MTNQEAPSGVIFNIQKFSLHDGPGIRTVVFFKGCPLSCKWCANPESQDTDIQILWDQTLCVGCGACIENCPEGAIKKSGRKLYIRHDRCRRCLACVTDCPSHALKAEGKLRSVPEVLAVCLQDEAFYEESGGGVTLSGGEPLMQPGFALPLLKALKGRGIHTAVETTGCIAPEVFETALPWTDLILFDIKHWDEHKHKEGTGVSNRLILENMKHALALGKEVLPRLPVIPGFNDSPRDAECFALRLKEAGADQVQLLPFHQFGERKYEMLDRAYAYAGIPALREEDLEEFRRAFLSAGIHAFF